MLLVYENVYEFLKETYPDQDDHDVLKLTINRLQYDNNILIQVFHCYGSYFKLCYCQFPGILLAYNTQRNQLLTHYIAMNSL